MSIMVQFGRLETFTTLLVSAHTELLYKIFCCPAANRDIFSAPSPGYLDISRHFAGRSA